MPFDPSDPALRITLGRLHPGQAAAHRALQRHRFRALRCGRRFGKTDYARIWITDGLLRGQEAAWFAPQHMTWSEVYAAIRETLAPLVVASSRNPPMIRLSTGGRIDFWSLGNWIGGTAGAITVS